MKSYKSVFICSFTILLGLVIVVNVNAQDPRKTLWLGGSMPTTKDWFSAQNDLSSNLYDYQFEDIIVTPSNNGDPGYDPEMGVLNAANNLTPILEEENDVLGIAHDYGGMILRELSNQSPNLSGMILSGVPNQGSLGIYKMINAVGNSDSEAQTVISAFEDIISPEKCQDCNLYRAFSDWINQVESNKNLYDDVEKNASVVNYLNDNMPEIAYAVLYGTVENFSIAQLMDDRAFPGNGNSEFGYEECYDRELEKLEARNLSAQIKREIRLIKAKPQSLFMQILGIIGGAVAQPNAENENGFDFSVFGQNFTLLPTPSSIVSIVNTLIEHQTNNQIYSLESQIAEIEAELEAIQLMICSTAQDFIEAQWELLVLQASEFEVEVVESIYTYSSAAEFDFCVDQCEIDLYFGDIPEDINCEAWCADIEPEEINEINLIIHQEGHDGLLTESEQQLEGENLANNYHLANTNHFFEQSMNNPDFAQAITDLFDGNAGMVFFVPKD
jgi:hypothetical protein